MCRAASAGSLDRQDEPGGGLVGGLEMGLLPVQRPVLHVFLAFFKFLAGLDGFLAGRAQSGELVADAFAPAGEPAAKTRFLRVEQRLDLRLPLLAALAHELKAFF